MYVDERYRDVDVTVATGPLVGGYSVVNSVILVSDDASVVYGHDVDVACLNGSTSVHLAAMLGLSVYCGSPDVSSGDCKVDLEVSDVALTEKYTDVKMLLAPARYIALDDRALHENMSTSADVRKKVGASAEVYSPFSGGYGSLSGIVEIVR